MGPGTASRLPAHAPGQGDPARVHRGPAGVTAPDPNLDLDPERAAPFSYRAPVLSRQRGPAPERVDAVHCHQQAEGPRRALPPQLLEHDPHGVRGVPAARHALLNHLSQRPALLRAFPLIPDVLLLGFYLETNETKTKNGYAAEG